MRQGDALVAVGPDVRFTLSARPPDLDGHGFSGIGVRLLRDTEHLGFYVLAEPFRASSQGNDRGFRHGLFKLRGERPDRAHVEFEVEDFRAHALISL